MSKDVKGSPVAGFAFIVSFALFAVWVIASVQG